MWKHAHTVGGHTIKDTIWKFKLRLFGLTAAVPDRLLLTLCLSRGFVFVCSLSLFFFACTHKLSSSVYLYILEESRQASYLTLSYKQVSFRYIYKPHSLNKWISVTASNPLFIIQGTHAHALHSHVQSKLVGTSVYRWYKFFRSVRTHTSYIDLVMIY